MNHHHHGDHRSPPPVLSAVKKTAVKTQRPTALSKTLSSSKITSKGGKNKASHSPTEDHHIQDKEEDDEMATGFLQFCAFCEKQIIVPNNSILYCSQSCRRKDGEKPASDIFFPTMYGNTSPMNDLNDPFGFTSRTIVPRRRPTTYPKASSKPPVLHDAKADLDPTEWKPDLKHRAKSDASEAFQFLSQFHSSTPGSSRRPELQTRSTTTSASVLNAPSLSHTPTASITSSEASPIGTPNDAPGYTASPSKKSVEMIKVNDSIGVKRAGSKKANLISPIVNNVSFEKKWIALSQEPVSGSLKKLLHLQETGHMGEM